MSMTSETAAASLLEWEAFLERVHQMGHAVDRERLPFFDGRDWEAEEVMQVWAGKYTRNIALHYREILQDQHIGTIRGILGKKCPVAVVGAGPSLDKNVEELRDFPGLILACDRAARCLTARGITPDIVVCVDPRQVLLAQMLNYSENALQVLALSVYCSPDVANAWKGKRLYFSTIHEGTQFHDRILPELFPGMPALFAAGNVGNTAVQLAAWMASGRIVLVGQDYGYTGERMHADEYVETDVAGSRGDRMRVWAKVPCMPDSDALRLRTGKVAVNGITTYNAFVGYKKSLHQIVDVMGLDLVNATEGGILTDFPCDTLRNVVSRLELEGHNHHNAAEARAALAQAITSAEANQ